VVGVMNWRKAKRSGEEGGNCVELAALAQVVLVRDSKDPDGPRLVLSREAFGSFVAVLRGCDGDGRAGQVTHRWQHSAAHDRAAPGVGLRDDDDH
jgi:hypothetical protein